MQTIRSFIAAEIDPAIQAKILQIIITLKQKIHEGVKWVSDQNIHLTLKFFGDIEQDKLTLLSDALQTTLVSFSPITIELAGIGAFPDNKRPRVVWVGIKDSPALMKMTSAIEELAVKTGVKAEERAYSAHITLGRVAKNADYLDIMKVGEAISSLKVSEIGTQIIHELVIFRSDLQHEGPTYTRIYKLQLGK
jgi:2'-5' RNA ligase